MKLRVCYDIAKNGNDFITEAVDNQSGLRRDVVELQTGQIFEIETTLARAKRFLNDPLVIVIPCGWSLADKEKWRALKNA